MTRIHRGLHRLIWIAVAVVLATGLTLALALRPAPAAPDHVVMERLR